MTLAVLSTHPIQYHAPVYRYLQTELGVPVTVIYGADFSVAGYHDREFNAEFSWDTDLLSGYTSVFLSRVRQGGAERPEATTAHGADTLLRSLQPAAILLTGYSSRFHREAFMLARRTRRPLFFRAETTDHALRRSSLKRIARDSILRALYSQFDRLLYIGKRSHAHYRRLGIREDRLIFSPYCVDTTPFRTSDAEIRQIRAEVRPQLGISDKQTILLYSGKIIRQKGPDLLIQACCQLPDNVRENLVLVFLGDGAMRPEVEDLARSIDTRFLGFQNQSRLSAYYSIADLLVVPSMSETWGLVVNEAMHFGLPCVVSDQVGCAPDLIVPGETGEVFASGSADSLAAAILRALERVGDARVTNACRSVIANYTVARAAEGIAQAFRQATCT